MNILLIVLGGAGGAVITISLQGYGVSAVVASSLVGLLGALVGFLISNIYLPAVVFVGSFAGMNTLLMASLPVIIVAEISTGLLSGASIGMLPGYEDHLGTIAFVTTLAIIWDYNLGVKKSILPFLFFLLLQFLRSFKHNERFWRQRHRSRGGRRGSRRGRYASQHRSGAHALSGFSRGENRRTSQSRLPLLSRFQERSGDCTRVRGRRLGD